jgi:uncharacterized membrane protein YraQ (UPF0718 family)
MLQQFADWIAYSLLGLDAQTRLGSAVDFFFYDTTKILILLFIISAIMGVINAYFPIDRLRTYLTTHKLYGLQYFFASLFGAITPFCSCSSIPLFIGFVKGGIPLGVTFAFLITSPLVNEVAVAMFLGTFGLKITIIYVISGMLLGMIGGFVLGKMRLENYLSDWVKNIQKTSEAETARWEAEKVTFLHRHARHPQGIVGHRQGCPPVCHHRYCHRWCSSTAMCPKDSSRSTCRRAAGLPCRCR